jgi:hypothetical protein
MSLEDAHFECVEVERFFARAGEKQVAMKMHECALSLRRMIARSPPAEATTFCGRDGSTANDFESIPRWIFEKRGVVIFGDFGTPARLFVAARTGRVSDDAPFKPA